ncbi:hypothetical protein BRC82_06775 [Halobacteriales archaeon QS_1_67_19]|nr:MAG: hypothetical protein BRC82_06775 [Halobacteriales archaeon QS_1_67_19]
MDREAFLNRLFRSIDRAEPGDCDLSIAVRFGWGAENPRKTSRVRDHEHVDWVNVLAYRDSVAGIREKTKLGMRKRLTDDG